MKTHNFKLGQRIKLEQKEALIIGVTTNYINYCFIQSLDNSWETADYMNVNTRHIDDLTEKIESDNLNFQPAY